MSDGWKIELLKDTSEVFTDGDWIETKDQSLEGIRLVQTGNIGFGYFKNKQDKARFISEETFKKLKCTELIEGDLLVSRLPDPVGKSCIIPDLDTKMITGVDCTIIRTKKYLLPEYLKFYQMSNNYLSDVKQRVTGTTRSRISRKNLGLIEIPIPPLEEQKEIVEILDKAFESIEKAKANIEKNIENAKELFQSKLNQIFSNQQEKGEEKNLGEIGTLTSSKRIFKKEYVSKGVPFYRSKEIKELGNKKDISLELFISENRYNEIKNKYGVPKKGDILLTAVGTIGEMYVVKEDDKFYFKDGNIMWLKNFNTLNSYYLKYALTYFVEQLKAISRGSAYSALTIQKLKAYSIPVPNIQKQKEIVETLDIVDNHIHSVLLAYNEELKNLEELKKSILQKAFSGELTNKNKAA